MSAEKRQRENTDTIAYVILGVIVVVILAIAFKGSFTEKPAQSLALVGGPIIEAEEYAQNKGSVQEITLSWGTLTYEPSIIHAKAGVPLRIKADLDHLSGCYRSFVVPVLGVNALFSEENDTVEVFSAQKGTYHFTCTMSMGKGTLIFD